MPSVRQNIQIAGKFLETDNRDHEAITINQVSQSKEEKEKEIRILLRMKWVKWRENDVAAKGRSKRAFGRSFSHSICGAADSSSLWVFRMERKKKRRPGLISFTKQSQSDSNPTVTWTIIRTRPTHGPVWLKEISLVHKSHIGLHRCANRLDRPAATMAYNPSTSGSCPTQLLF